MNIQQLADRVGAGMELVGIVVLVIGAAAALVQFVVDHNTLLDQRYERLRRNLGRAILLGLEFLVAADIIDTVAVEPTLEKVYILGLIVLIRTFLSFALATEIEGRLPWQTRGS